MNLSDKQQEQLRIQQQMLADNLAKKANESFSPEDLKQAHQPTLEIGADKLEQVTAQSDASFFSEMFFAHASAVEIDAETQRFYDELNERMGFTKEVEAEVSAKDNVVELRAA